MLVDINDDLYSEDGLPDDDQQKLNSSTSDISVAASDTDTSSVDGHNRKRTRRRNNRGNRGNGGNRGNRGNHHQLQRTLSTDDLLRAINALSDDGPNKSTSFLFGAANDTVDASSFDGPNAKQIQNPIESVTFYRGRGGNVGSRANRGNHQQLQRTHSTGDITAAVNNEENRDDGLNRGERRRPVRGKLHQLQKIISVETVWNVI